MFGTWFGSEEKDPAAAAPSNGAVFHEYPHPEDWRDIVDALVGRFGPDGEEIPADMCPCGNRKATARRFLVARKYKIDDAEKMLRDTIAWRQTVAVGDSAGVDGVLGAKPRWDLLAENRKIIPASPFHGYTKQGYPVYMLRLGKGDGALAASSLEECHVYCSIVRGEHLVKVVVPEAQKRHLANGGRRGMEARMREAAREAGDAVSDAPEDGSYPEDDEHDIMDKQVVIVDLEGLGMSALRCLYVFKVINSVASYNYPELSKAIYVLNSPSVFDYLWSAVKPLLAAHTQSKIRIFQSGPEQYKALQQLFEDADIPDYLTPQVEGEQTKGRVGSVTSVEEPDFRPEGVKAMDEWIEGLSEAEDKKCPFPSE
jgi:hypothetical protein